MAQKKNQILRRKIRVRKKLLNIEKHRLHVYRSSKHIYAAVTSIENDKTLCSFSSMKIKKVKIKKK